MGIVKIRRGAAADIVFQIAREAFMGTDMTARTRSPPVS